MVVGPTGGGKSVVINTLVKAQTAMGITTKCITLNPKVCHITNDHFYLGFQIRTFNSIFSFFLNLTFLSNTFSFSPRKFPSDDFL